MNYFNYRRYSKLLFFLFSFTGILFSCKQVAESNIDSLSNKPYSYSYRFRALYIISCDIGVLPDSIINRDIKHLYFYCYKPGDFIEIVKQINPHEIRTLTIDGLQLSSANFDFAKFTQLVSIRIGGDEKVKSVNLTNLGNNLKRLSLAGPNLKLPDFDSAFYGLNDFYYIGTTDTIPKWIENLNNCRSITFKSDNLSDIKADLCKMDKLSELAIVDYELKDKEAFISKMKVYPLLLEFKKCKPDLSYWRRLMPK